MEKRRPAEQRNCSQPAAPRKEKHSAVFGQDKHQPSRSGVPGGTMDWVRPRCLQEELGLEPGNPAHQRLDRPFPLQTPSGGSPTLTPYRSMTPAVTKRKKGLTTRGPLQKQRLIGLETGQLSNWLTRTLCELGLPVVCVDARHAKAALKLQVNKTDANDAWGLAQIVRTGWFRSGSSGPRSFRIAKWLRRLRETRGR